jgi:predicted MPP superfamily phosphohydrolase
LGQRWLVVEQVPIPMRGLQEAHEGLTITHISDLHIGPQLRGKKLQAMVDRVNALETDLIAITGDIFDSDPSFIDDGCRTLAGLRAGHGVFACLGNHDVYTGVEAVTAGLAKHTSIRVLRDEWIRVDVRGEPVYVLGLDDPGRGWAGRRLESEALARICQEVPDAPARVLLTHRPTYFGQIAELRVPLAIAGHTHGGQVTLPPPGHHHNISRLVTEWTRGLFERTESLLYVNRGLGVAGLPVRLNCPREIAVLRLTART